MAKNIFTNNELQYGGFYLLSASKSLYAAGRRRSSGNSTRIRLVPDFPENRLPGWPRTVVAGLWSIVLTFSGAAAGAQDLFAGDELLEVELRGSVNSLIKHKEQRAMLPFEFSLHEVTYPVLLSARGKSRMRLCDFPLFHLHLRDGKKIKIVTHCRDYESSEKNVLEEYLAYRIFNLLSDISYKTRLLRVRYTDLNEADGNSTIEHFAFAIEPTAWLAERVGGTREGLDAVPRRRLNHQQEALVYVFQYLIGNTDWSLVTADGSDECCHNGRLIAIESQLHYVPYDFDLAGLVSARYAKPDPSLGLKNVRQRRYRGLCLQDDFLTFALRTTKLKSSEIYRLTDEVPGLNDKDRKKLTRYLDKFFELADDEQQLLAKFRRRCL